MGFLGFCVFFVRGFFVFVLSDFWVICACL